MEHGITAALRLMEVSRRVGFLRLLTMSLKVPS